MSRPKLRTTTLCSGLIAEQRLRQRAAMGMGTTCRPSRKTTSSERCGSQAVLLRRTHQTFRGDGHETAHTRKRASSAGETPFRRSCRHVECGNKADLIVIQVGGLSGCDAHLKPVLLAQDKHLLNGEGLNFSGRETERERNGRSNLSVNARADRSRRRQAAFLSWRRIQAACGRNLIEQGKLGHKFW